VRRHNIITRSSISEKVIEVTYATQTGNHSDIALKPVLQAGHGRNDTVGVLRWLVVAALLVPTVLFGLAAWKDRAELMTRVEDDGHKILLLFYEQAENLFSGHDIILDMIVSRMRDSGWDAIGSAEDLLRELEVVDRRLDDASEILLVDADGTTRATTVHLQPSEPPPAADGNCFAMLKAGAISCISARHIGPSSGRNLFSLSRRLERGGLFNGIAQVAISADYIVNLWASSTPSQTDVVTLARSNGSVLARSTAVQADMGAPRAAAGRPDRVIIQKDVAGYPAYITLDLDKGAVLSQWYAHVVVYGAVALCTTAGMVMALGIAIRRVRNERGAVERLRESEMRLLVLQSELLHVSRLNEMGQMAATLAHELNQPLTAIASALRGALRMLQVVLPAGQDGAMVPPRALEAVDRAAAQSLRAGQIVRRLREFVARSDVETRVEDLRQLINEAGTLALLGTKGRGIAVSFRFASDLPPVLVDRIQIQQVLINLIRNAVEAMSDKSSHDGTVCRTLVVAAAPTDPEMVEVSVADTGPGLATEITGRTFEAFVTTKPSGMGIGLLVCRSIIEAHGGRIWTEPNVGGGTVFRFTLRAVDEAERSEHRK
jgi:signal transduction histidine kinase